MTKYYNIDLDGMDGYEHWDDYPVCPENGYTEEDMLTDVRGGLEELGGGYADIWDADTDELFAAIKI